MRPANSSRIAASLTPDEGGQSLWGNSAALLAGTVASRFSRAAAFLFSARMLGPDGFGPVATGLAAYEMLRVVGEAGLDTRLIRRVAQHPNEAARDTRGTVALKAKLGAALLALGVVVAGATAGRSGLKVFLGLAVGIFGVAVSGSTVAMATAQLNARGLVPYHVITGLAFFIAVVGPTALLRTPTSTALAIGLGDVAGGIVMGTYLLRSPGALSQGLRMRPGLVALRESWPVAGVSILATAYARLGIVALAVTWGSAAVAQYGVSYRIVEVFLLASSAIAGSAYAVTARIDALGSEGATQTLVQHVLRSIAIPLLALTVTIAAGAQLLPVALGERYAPAVATMQVLAWALPPMFVNGLLSAHLYGRGRYHTVFRIALTNLLINSALVVLLVPASGPPAVALAVVATESVNTALQSRAAGVSYRTPSWAIAALSLLAGVFTFAIAPGTH
jgi:O-antigen/teichoic acid export membrane protein